MSLILLQYGNEVVLHCDLQFKSVLNLMVKKGKQSRYRLGVAQRVPGS
jgi:hypothetical protein